MISFFYAEGGRGGQHGVPQSDRAIPAMRQNSGLGTRRGDGSGPDCQKAWGLGFGSYAGRLELIGNGSFVVLRLAVSAGILSATERASLLAIAAADPLVR